MAQTLGVDVRATHSLIESRKAAVGLTISRSCADVPPGSYSLRLHLGEGELRKHRSATASDDKCPAFVGPNTCLNEGNYVSRDHVVVFYSPLHEARGSANGRLAEGGVSDAEHAELSGQAIQVQADAVEVGIGGTPGQG